MDIAQLGGISSANLASGVRVLGQDSSGFGDFAQLLASMGGDLLSTGSTLGATGQDTGGLSLEEMQAMMGLNGQSSAWNMTSTSNSDAVSQMMSILVSITKGLSAEDLDADKARELMDLVSGMQDELWKNSIQNSQMLVAEQLMSMMGSDTGQSNTLNLLNSLNQTTNTQPIMELMVQSKPEEILEMITGIPGETFANLASESNQAAISVAAKDALPQVNTPQEGIITSGDLETAASTERIASQAQSDQVTAAQARGGEAGTSAQPELSVLNPLAQTTDTVLASRIQAMEQPGALDEAETAETTQNTGETFSTQPGRAEQTKATQETAQPQRKEIDIERLQTQVDQGVYLRGTGFAGKATIEAKVAESEELAQNIGTQVNTGILTGLKGGEEQFSIKLNPEGLGEVLVKITKSAVGEMTLNLVTKSDETQRLLATQLEMLKANLTPLNVKVDQVMTEQQEMFYNQQQAFEQQQRSWSWQNEGFAGAGVGATTAAESTVAEVLAQSSPKSALDTYV